MRKHKLVYIIIVLAFSTIFALTLAACQTSCTHKYGDWVNRNGEETYCENRLYFRECENCGEKEWKEGLASDHDFEIETVEPTCEAGGYDLKTCIHCGKTQTLNNTPPIATHDFSVWQSVGEEEAFCDERIYTRTCKDCGEAESRDGSASDHDFEAGIVESTCDAGGYEYITCILCGKSEVLSGSETEKEDHELIEGYAFDSTSHWRVCKYFGHKVDIAEHEKNEDGFCTVCEKNIAGTAGLVYSAQNSSECTVIGYEGTANEIVIPSVFGDKRVTGIERRAFFGRDITEVVISDGIGVIGTEAFSNCYELNSVSIPQSVTTIEQNAFLSCTSLVSVHIPKGVNYVGEGAFAACSSLTNITVDEDNITYCSVDGNLCYKGGKVLVQYATGKADSTFIISDDVEIIMPHTFMGCVNLASVVIGDNVKYILDWAFMGCVNLTSVVIGNSVGYIGNSVFAICDNLLSVYCYEGSDIDISDYVPETSVTYYYSESEPTKDGNYWHYGENGEIVVWQENASQGLLFELNDNGISYTVVGMGDCEDTEIVIPRVYNGLPVTAIGENAFSENGTITHVTIPDTVLSIETTAFAGCNVLGSVIIGKGVNSLGYGVFANCPSLAVIWVDDNNAAYKQISGDLYTKDGKILVQYAMGKTGSEFVVPSHVEGIYVGAFAYSQNLTSIIIPESVKKIGISAFYKCDSLQSIIIGQSVEYIGFDAFDYCDMLAYVYYAGSQSEWDSIVIGGEDDELLDFDTIYYYSNSEPIESGNFWHYDEDGEIEIW